MIKKMEGLRNAAAVLLMLLLAAEGLRWRGQAPGWIAGTLFGVLLALGAVLWQGLAALPREARRLETAAARAARQAEQATLIRALRVQKHDFANQLQVLSGFAQLGKTDRLLSYVQEAAAEMTATAKLAGIEPPAVRNALLAAAYTAQAELLPLTWRAETDFGGLSADPGRAAAFFSGVFDRLLRLAKEAAGTEDGFVVHLGEDQERYIVELAGPAAVLRELADGPLPPETGSAREWLAAELGGSAEYAAAGEAGARLTFVLPKKNGAAGGAAPAHKNARTGVK